MVRPVHVGWQVASSFGALDDEMLVDRLLMLLKRTCGNRDEDMAPLTLDRALRDAPPGDVQLLPLTW